MTPKDNGRIDYAPRAHDWKVIWYQGTKETTVARFLTREEASQFLINLVKSNSKRSRKG